MEQFSASSNGLPVVLPGCFTQCSAAPGLQHIGSQGTLPRVATAQDLAMISNTLAATYQQQQQQPGGGMLPPAALQPFLQLCSDYLGQSLGQPAVQVSQPQPVIMPMMPHTNLFNMEPQNLSNSTLFFAGVVPTVAVEALLSVFARFGRVMDLNLFRPYKGCRTSKGCGLVVFSQHAEAAAALQALNGRFVWPGARSPMVIEWCDPSKQHKPKPQQQAAPAFMPPLPQQQQQQQQPTPHLLPGASAGLNLVPQGLMGHMMLPHSC